MQAVELIIDAKVKSGLFDIVGAHDFRTHAGGTVDARAVLTEPTLSFYCLDHANRQALFVETPPDFDLLAAPFYFVAQYQAAQRLIAVPYATLHALADAVDVDPARVILFYSTGRCGSTLFSHVMNLNPAMVSFSEPDVFSQLVMMRTAGWSDDAETTALLRDAVMIMSANARSQGFAHFAFKFRSYVLSVSDLLYLAVPQAKLLFMYRNALTWAQSFSRSFGATDADLKQRWDTNNFRYMIPGVDAHLRAHGQITWPEYLAHMWVTTMQESRRLQAQGAALGHASFEDLRATPEPVIRALLAHCDLPMPPSDQLDRVLGKDSQAGTPGAQNRPAPVRVLTDAELAAFAEAIRTLDPDLRPDTVLV